MHLNEGQCVVLATSEEEAVKFTEAARENEMDVVASTVWNGIVPPHSYILNGDGVRMSSAEFFLFRMVSGNSEEVARKYVCEMFGTVVTNLTMTSIPDGQYDEIDEPRTDLESMYWYLYPVLWESAMARQCMQIMIDVSDDEIEGYAAKVRGSKMKH